MWNWQEAMAIKYKRDEILEDILKDSSLFLEMAKEDVAKIFKILEEMEFYKYTQLKGFFYSEEIDRNFK